jgi:hypothetical protein
MPILSQYWFFDSLFAGQFAGFNEPYPQGGAVGILRQAQSHGTLTWIRLDNELVIELAVLLSNPVVTKAIDGLLKGKASRTSSVMAQGLLWHDAPYHDQDPRRHAEGDMLVRVYFDIHIPTPWFCTDADGSVSYYLVFYLDAEGNLNAYVDASGWEFEGGWGLCEEGVEEELRKSVPDGVSTVQTLLADAIALLGSQHYSMLYYLPGSGTRGGGDFQENASTDVALALIPR